jgi:hypothetical protein
MASVFDLLDNEWRRLSHDRSAARRLAGVCAIAGGARSLGDVERFVRGAHPGDADRVLLALVARAVESDDLAARVLLQLLLPGARSLARRWWALGDDDERAAATVMAVYHRICRYPLVRRPGRVAANILMDAAHELRRAVPPVVSFPAADPGAHGIATRRRDDGAAPGAAAELAGVLRDAVAAGVVDPDDAEVIFRTRVAGDRVEDLALHRGLRPRTLWNRRQRAERALVTAQAAAARRPHRLPRRPAGTVPGTEVVGRQPCATRERASAGGASGTAA